MNKTAKIGENVTFKCIELFSLVLTGYRWLHWKRLPPNYPKLELNNNEPSLNSSYYTMVNPKHYQPFTFKQKEEKYGGRLLLNNVTEEDAGMYTCLISNQIGKGWRSAWLTVITSGKRQCLRFTARNATDLLQVDNFTGFRGQRHSQRNNWAFCTEHAPNLARNPWGEGVKFNMAAYE